MEEPYRKASPNLLYRTLWRAWTININTLHESLIPTWQARAKEIRGRRNKWDRPGTYEAKALIIITLEEPTRLPAKRGMTLITRMRHPAAIRWHGQNDGPEGLKNEDREVQARTGTRIGSKVQHSPLLGPFPQNGEWRTSGCIRRRSCVQGGLSYATGGLWVGPSQVIIYILSLNFERPVNLRSLTRLTETDRGPYRYSTLAIIVETVSPKSGWQAYHGPKPHQIGWEHAVVLQANQADEVSNPT